MEGVAKKNIFTIFFMWYFSEVPSLIYKKGAANLIRILDLFSIPIHLRTLFAPWKQDIVSIEGIPFFERFQYYAWNFFSRIIGFMVRSVVVLVGLIVIAFEIIVSTIYYLAWFILPLIALSLIFYGVILLF